MSRYTRAVFCIWAAAAVLITCSGKKQPSREDQARKMLQNFFFSPGLPGMPLSGLWIVDQASVTELIEKKYLAQYVAKPDEAQATDIRERLKSLTIFFRVQPPQIAMLTFVADNFGFSAGSLTARKGTPGVFDALMRGKGESQKAVFRYTKKAGREILEYDEGGLVMTASRELRTPDELTALFLQRLRSGTGLVQY